MSRADRGRSGARERDVDLAPHRLAMRRAARPRRRRAATTSPVCVSRASSARPRAPMPPRSSDRGGCRATPASRPGRSGSSAASAERPILDRRGDARSTLASGRTARRRCVDPSRRSSSRPASRIGERRSSRAVTSSTIGSDEIRRATNESTLLVRRSSHCASSTTMTRPGPSGDREQVEGRDRDQEWIRRRSGREPERGLDRPPLGPRQRAELAEDGSQELVEARVGQVRLGPDAGCPKDRDRLSPDILDQGPDERGLPGPWRTADQQRRSGLRDALDERLQQRQLPLPADQAERRAAAPARAPRSRGPARPVGTPGPAAAGSAGPRWAGRSSVAPRSIRSLRPPSSGPPSRPLPREMGQELDPADLLPAPRARGRRLAFGVAGDAVRERDQGGRLLRG